MLVELPKGKVWQIWQGPQLASSSKQLGCFFLSSLFFRGTPQLSQGLDVLDMFNSCAIFALLSPLSAMTAFNFFPFLPATQFQFCQHKPDHAHQLRGQYSNPIATFIGANRSNLWLMHQSQVERDRDNLMLSAARQLLALSFALSLNFDEIFYVNAALNQKQQQQQQE